MSSQVEGEPSMEPGKLETALEREAAGWAREHLAGDVVAWLTTVAADGTPQSSVISFLWEGNTILFYSQPDTPKLRNIARSPLVSFNLQSDPYGDHMLIIEGTAAEDRAVPPSDEHAAYAAKYREPLRHWEMGEAETAGDFSIPIRITPRRIRLA
jgi:PPOX class probable F420-dependent enzyme